jgi:hypothetical protein
MECGDLSPLFSRQQIQSGNKLPQSKIQPTAGGNQGLIICDKVAAFQVAQASVCARGFFQITD